MNLVKCENGHFYDEERYQSCPHCAAPALRNSNLTQPVQRTPENDAVTVALDQSEATGALPSASAAPVAPVAAPAAGTASGSLQDAVKAAAQGAVNAPPVDGDKTVGFFASAMGKEPVVGWLVCTKGEHFGEDFRLKSGRNFVGRAANMDVPVTKDTTVSRERHAVLVYEPRGNAFIVQPGDSKELCYLNGQVVLSPQMLNPHDRLLLGKTELMFIPCCTPNFNWEAAKGEEKEEG